MQTYFEYLAASFVPEWHLMNLRNLLQLWILGSCKIIFLYLLLLCLPRGCCTPLGSSTYFPLRCSVPAEGMWLYSLHSNWIFLANLRTLDCCGSEWWKSWSGCKGKSTVYPVGRGHTVLSVVASKACESSLPTNSCLVLLATLQSIQLNQITQVWTQLLTKRVSSSETSC